MISSSPGSNNTHQLAFSSRCLPGSPAELEEKERIAEFQRRKDLRKAEEEQEKPERDAEREQKYQAATDANRERMRKSRAPQLRHPDAPRPVHAEPNRE